MLKAWDDILSDVDQNLIPLEDKELVNRMLKLVKEYNSNRKSKEFDFVISGLSIMYETSKNLRNKLSEHKQQVERILEKAGTLCKGDVIEEKEIKQSLTKKTQGSISKNTKNMKLQGKPNLEEEKIEINSEGSNNMDVDYTPSLRLDSGHYMGQGPAPYNNSLKQTEAYVFGICLKDDDSWKSEKDIV